MLMMVFLRESWRFRRRDWREHRGWFVQDGGGCQAVVRGTAREGRLMGLGRRIAPVSVPEQKVDVIFLRSLMRAHFARGSRSERRRLRGLRWRWWRRWRRWSVVWCRSGPPSLCCRVFPSLKSVSSDPALEDAVCVEPVCVLHGPVDPQVEGLHRIVVVVFTASLRRRRLSRIFRISHPFRLLLLLLARLLVVVRLLLLLHHRRTHASVGLVLLILHVLGDPRSRGRQKEVAVA